MRYASWLLFIPLVAILAAGGCNDHDRPKSKPGGNKAADEKKNDPVAENKQKPDNNPGGGVKPAKSLLGNIRNRAIRTEMDNELKQLFLFVNQYYIEFPNAGSRSEAGYLNYIKRDAPKLHEKIKEEKFYTLNLKANLSSDDIVIYETEPYPDGFYCLRANNMMGIVPEKEWKAGLGMP